MVKRSHFCVAQAHVGHANLFHQGPLPLPHLTRLPRAPSLSVGRFSNTEGHRPEGVGAVALSLAP